MDRNVYGRWHINEERLDPWSGQRNILRSQRKAIWQWAQFGDWFSNGWPPSSGEWEVKSGQYFSLKIFLTRTPNLFTIATYPTLPLTINLTPFTRVVIHCEKQQNQSSHPLPTAREKPAIIEFRPIGWGCTWEKEASTTRTFGRDMLKGKFPRKEREMEESRWGGKSSRYAKDPG